MIAFHLAGSEFPGGRENIQVVSRQLDKRKPSLASNVLIEAILLVPSRHVAGHILDPIMKLSHSRRQISFE